MCSAVFQMSFGEKKQEEPMSKKLSYFAYAPQICLLIILLLTGINIPSQILDFLNSAAGFFK
jgi:hypothetical protein